MQNLQRGLCVCAEIMPVRTVRQWYRIFCDWFHGAINKDFDSDQLTNCKKQFKRSHETLYKGARFSINDVTFWFCNYMQWTGRPCLSTCLPVCLPTMGLVMWETFTVQSIDWGTLPLYTEDLYRLKGMALFASIPSVARIVLPHVLYEVDLLEALWSGWTRQGSTSKKVESTTTSRNLLWEKLFLHASLSREKCGDGVIPA